MSSKIITICGGSASGKSFLAREMMTNELKNNNFVTLDMEGKMKHYLIEEFGSLKEVNNKKSYYIYNKLKYADPRINSVNNNSNNSDYIVTLDDGSEKSLEEVSNKYIKLLTLFIALKNKKNIIVDNFDLCFTGSGFRNIINAIISEIVYNKNKVIFTFTDMSLWQLFSLSIPKDVDKKFIFTKYMYKDMKYDHLELSYNDLAFTISYLYDKEVRKELEEKNKNKRFKPADLKQY